MLKDGVYQITNVHTKQALYIGADAENGSELKTRDRITSWSEFRVESQGGRAYTLVADHNGMSARISDKKNVPVASRSSFKFHLIAISTPLKQYR
ncbi:hypothetical protein NEOLEDRAFT_1137034 [Neolentinus lepideus HHB14362 ss-1]|uniref:Ricin B lectin domain-containing protein n=1 Tax=Neolentinus lepideus HHB14362 ss-1 TaxID=1314782 RepID=A0A165R162_9AGAM|nr:hypothetical protein NEOLEDRAFT_1137034 [Neolentinus lepideus HHB14362 ss-1]